MKYECVKNVTDDIQNWAKSTRMILETPKLENFWRWTLQWRCSPGTVPPGRDSLKQQIVNFKMPSYSCRLNAYKILLNFKNAFELSITLELIIFGVFWLLLSKVIHHRTRFSLKYAKMNFCRNNEFSRIRCSKNWARIEFIAPQR